MIYGYIRVSTDRQTVENQRFEVENFCKKKDMTVEVWAEETISGTKKIDTRVLGEILERMQKGDILVISELSRIGRVMLEIMSFLNEAMNRGIIIQTVKEKYVLGDDITSKVLAFAFSLSAELERNLISQRTTEALARRKSLGVKMGRPKGKKTKKICLKCAKYAQIIQDLLEKKTSITAIARKIGVHRITLTDYISGKTTGRNVEREIEDKIKSAKKYIRNNMPKFVSGDVDYLRKNLQEFINLKNDGYSYSNLSVALGVDIMLLQGLFN